MHFSLIVRKRVGWESPKWFCSLPRPASAFSSRASRSPAPNLVPVFVVILLVKSYTYWSEQSLDKSSRATLYTEEKEEAAKQAGTCRSDQGTLGEDRFGGTQPDSIIPRVPWLVVTCLSIYPPNFPTNPNKENTTSLLCTSMSTVPLPLAILTYSRFPFRTSYPLPFVGNYLGILINCALRFLPHFKCSHSRGGKGVLTLAFCKGQKPLRDLTCSV